MKTLTYIILLSFVFISCSNIIEWEEPEFLDGSILDETEPFTENVKNNLEGVYKIVSGNNTFGRQVVLKWYGNTLSVFGDTLGTYFKLNAGQKDSTLFFEGTWRHFVSTNGGLLRFYISKEDGAGNLSTNNLSAAAFKLSGSFGDDDNPLDKNITLEYLRPISEETLAKNFYILAHRGGGRNSDYLGVSENSIEILSIVEELGANGIEIDIKLSKDNIPFLYHDRTINLRLTQESPIWGPIEDFSFSQIRTFVRLKNGERIPSFEEALEFVLYKTNLKFVWLDMKSEKNEMAEVIKIQQRILQEAAQIGRELEIMVGLPSDEKANVFMKYPEFENVSSLCELSKSVTRKSNSQVWAPRWTLGTQIESVTQMQSEGRKVFTWTLDDAQFISKYIKESKFDGILTNYPTIVAYYHYAR
ncbi:MAG: glycerophosphodiester phosphodiesterase [Ignavibacteriae bacterium]|nr:glycerophosphodiester phosphodiesterase [Ignavibacteriota bacterium]